MTTWIEWNNILINTQQLESIERVNGYNPVESMATTLSYLSLVFVSGSEINYRFSDYSLESVEQLYQLLKTKVLAE